MKRKARDGGDLDTDKLNVFIAACLIDSYGFKWFSSEAKSLLEAANLTFEERMRQDNHAGLDEIHAFCLLKLGTCFLAESLTNKDDEQLFSQGMELLKRAENVFKEQLAEKCTTRAFITEINFVIAGNFGILLTLTSSLLSVKGGVICEIDMARVGDYPACLVAIMFFTFLLNIF